MVELVNTTAAYSAAVTAQLPYAAAGLPVLLATTTPPLLPIPGTKVPEGLNNIFHFDVEVEPCVQAEVSRFRLWSFSATRTEFFEFFLFLPYSRFFPFFAFFACY